MECDLEKWSGLLQNGIKFIKCDLQSEAVKLVSFFISSLPFPKLGLAYKFLCQAYITYKTGEIWIKIWFWLYCYPQ